MKLITILAISVLGLGAAVGFGQAPARGAGRAGAAARGNLAGAAGRAGGAERAAARGRAGVAAKAPAERIDKREANQQRRIDAGVAKGQLTPDEVAKLQGLETSIATLESTFKSDGKLQKNEVQQLRQALNDASLQIWAERHDTEGNQKPVSRLGRDIFAQDQLTAKIESGNLTGAQAKSFLQDFRKMVTDKRRLSSDTLTPEQRTELQAQYNNLLNQYFLIK